MAHAKVIYVDIDDTLMRSFGSKRIPVSHVVELVRELAAAGASLYCWTSGGGEYAQSTAVELGIADCFAAFLPKPHAIIDDSIVADWRLVELHPNECRGLTAAEILARIP